MGSKESNQTNKTRFNRAKFTLNSDVDQDTSIYGLHKRPLFFTIVDYAYDFENCDAKDAISSTLDGALIII